MKVGFFLFDIFPFLLKKHFTGLHIFSSGQYELHKLAVSKRSWYEDQYK